MGATLEDVKNGASVRGVASAQVVHVVSVDWIGDQAINVVYRDHNGTVAEGFSIGMMSTAWRSSRMADHGHSTLMERCCVW